VSTADGAGFTRAELDAFRELLESRTGLVFDESKEPALAEAVAAASEEIGAASSGELLTRCRAGEEAALRALVSRLTVRETYFFRNRPHFRALRDVILPELLSRAETRRELRLWSAGCSTGEEAYSLAMTLLDACEGTGRRPEEWRLEVLATDIDPDALELARSAEYGRYSFRGVLPKEEERYFEPAGERLRVRAPYRRLVRFDTFNLKTDGLPDPGGPWHDLDLIVCRNVTIYFSTDTTRRLAERFYETLREGGYLVVGHSEHSLETYRRFETHALPDAILYRRAGEGSLRDSEGRGSTSVGRALHALWRAPDRARGRPSPRGPAGPAPAQPPGESDPVTLESARAALLAGDLDRAVAMSVDVLERDATDADAALLLGELAADRGHRAEADIWLRRALELRPLDLTAHYVLALLATERGELGEALEHVGRAHYVDPDFLMGHYLAARLHRESGRPEACLRSLRTALRICDRLDDEREVPFGEGLTVGGFRRILESEAP
jgi:chemotaxis protein methyltransferase CheR